MRAHPTLPYHLIAGLVASGIIEIWHCVVRPFLAAILALELLILRWIPKRDCRLRRRCHPFYGKPTAPTSLSETHHPSSSFSTPSFSFPPNLCENPRHLSYYERKVSICDHPQQITDSPIHQAQVSHSLLRHQRLPFFHPLSADLHRVPTLSPV